MVEGVFPKAILGEWVPGGLKLQVSTPAACMCITSPLTLSTYFHLFIYLHVLTDTYACMYHPEEDTQKVRKDRNMY